MVPVNIRVGYPLGYRQTSYGLEGNQFLIYPNPGRNLFFMKAAQTYNDVYLAVTDITGREIVSKHLDNNSLRISIDDLEPGIYIFKLIFDNKIEKHRVVIQ